MKHEIKFPDGFYWGAATASYQVEGGIYNCDWAEAADKGKVPPAGKLADHYNLYEKDFDIAKALGHNAHRFSVEWSRIEPEDGVFDETELEHYRQVLRSLKVRKLEPFVTLWHFTLPLWFSESGGFERKDAPEIFARYCSKVVTALKADCQNFSTINEPIGYANNGWVRGQWPPFKRWTLFSFVKVANSGQDESAAQTKGLGSVLTFLRVRSNLAKAHVAAYAAIKAIAPNVEVSVVRDVIVFSSDWKPWNMLLAAIMNWFWTHQYNNRLKGKVDSYGLNYYFYKKFGDQKVYKKTDMNWDFVPEGLFDAMKLLERYKKPIYIAEVGIADRNDIQRSEYIHASVTAIGKALEQGIVVKGFMYWSLLDNYEWALGTGKRFGLVEVDYDTLLRKVRHSAYEYKKIILKNAVTVDDVSA